MSASRNRLRAIDGGRGEGDGPESQPPARPSVPAPAAVPDPADLECPPRVREAAEALCTWMERASADAPDAPADATADSPADAPDDLGLDELGEAVSVLRDELLREPGGRAAELHRRLDAAHGALAGRILSRTVEENRKLLQDVSHDIRSPLNSILFLADTLLSQHSGELNAVQTRQVGVLYTASVTLVSLVNDLIDAARLGDATQISVSHVSFSLESALHDVESLVRPLATHRSVALGFHLETLGARSGDRQLLSRILINLVTNAVKVAEDGGSVDVRVREAGDGSLLVEVRDDGPGEDVARLRELIDDRGSDPYPMRRTSGWTHGLGLTISARLVRAAGGELNVESEPGVGTAFTVRLPFQKV